MSGLLSKSFKKQMLWIIYWQLILLMGLALVIFLLQGIHRGWSALLGGLAYWLPTVIFLLRVSVYTGARAATRFMIAFFTGETVKLFLSAVLFLAAVKFCSINVVYGILGLIGAVIAFWVVSVASLNRQEVKV